MAKAPAFQWYPGDCDTDEKVRLMTDEEFGFYMRCLNHAWLNGGLPGNLEDISRILPRHPLKLARLWQTVSTCFELIGGRYRNRKQEEQRAKNQALSESRRSAASSRWSMHLHEPENASASILHMQRKKTEEEVLFTSKEEETSKQERQDATWVREQHDGWYDKAFWNKKDRAGSLKAYGKALTRLWKTGNYSLAEAAAFLFQAAIDDRARFESTQEWEWRSKLHPATWLNNDRWGDQPSIVVTPKRAQKESHSAMIKKALGIEED